MRECLFTMMRALSVMAALGAMLVARRGAACDQWTGMLDVRSTAIRAGLVVVAHRSDSTIALVSDDPPWEAFATFEVEEVLKGSPPAPRIPVATAWLHDGGIKVEPGNSVVLFLERRGNRYYPVREGCAVVTLPVTNGDVGRTLPPCLLARSLGVTWTVWPPRDPMQGGVPLPLVLAVACAGVGFALGNHVGRRR